jgi:hypothetical protein
MLALTGTNQTFSLHHVSDVFLEVVLLQSIEVEITMDRVWAECGWARYTLQSASKLLSVAF